jgi:hypothetical protein
MDGFTQILEGSSERWHPSSLFCDLSCSEQQRVSGGMGSIDLGLPVGLVVARTNKDGVLGVTRDGYEFTKEDLFRLIGQTTGVVPPISASSVAAII